MITVSCLLRFTTVFLAATAFCEADVLFNQDFDHKDTERLGGTIAGVYPWEGRSMQEFGWIGIGGPTSALTFFDSSAITNQSPSVRLSWTDNNKEPAKISMTWNFMIPVKGEYLGVYFIGGRGWLDSALVVMFSNGDIIADYYKGRETREVIGTYTPGEWDSITISFDEKARTFGIGLGGKVVIRDALMLPKGPAKIALMTVAADAAPVDRKNEAVLFLDNISVVSQH